MGESVQYNDDQLRAVQCLSKRVLVLAGPGTGKTAVIAGHIRYLTEQGVPPERILVITFTRAAAAEMEKRSRMTGDAVPLFGTFHSVFFRFLREAGLCRASSIASEAEKRSWLRDILEKSERVDGTKDLAGDPQEVLTDLLDAFSAVKASGTAPEDYTGGICRAELFASLYQEYEAERRKRGKLDFDDILLEFAKAMRERESFRERLQEKYTHLIVDEFQDVNRTQYEGLCLLAGKEHHLFCVGDDDQSIYGFRGADPGIMLHFPEDHPDTERITLRLHYRCLPEIVKAAEKLIGHNQERFQKRLTPFRSGKGRLTCRVYEDSYQEAGMLARTIRERHEKGTPWEDMAVLYRAETVLPALLRAFDANGVLYRFQRNARSFYDKALIRELLSYIRLAEGRGNREDFLRVMNIPNRFISRMAVQSSWSGAGLASVYEKLRAYYATKPVMVERLRKWEDDMKRISRLPPSVAVVYLRHAVGFERAAVRIATEAGGEKESVLQLLNECQEKAQNYHTLSEWLEAVQDEKSRAAKPDQNKGIALMTMHASKGLEFPIVFLPVCNETVIPNGRAAMGTGLEEERRIFYVAMTRAKDELHLSCARERMDISPPVSRFLGEAGLVPKEFDKAAFTDRKW